MLADMRHFLSGLPPEAWEYKHNERCTTVTALRTFGPPCSPVGYVPFVNRPVDPGYLAKIAFMDFDNRNRSAGLLFQMVGE